MIRPRLLKDNPKLRLNISWPPRPGDLLPLTEMLMAGRGGDANRTKMSADQPPPPPPPPPPLPRSSTFPLPPPTAAPPLFCNPKAPQHQPPPPPLPLPQPTAGHHAVPVGYQSHPYPYPAMVDGLPMTMREPPLPFCGIGVGWALFVLGFFFAAIPWYVGAFIWLFVSQDCREKPGLIACTIAAVLTLLSIILHLF